MALIPQSLSHMPVTELMWKEEKEAYAAGEGEGDDGEILVRFFVITISCFRV